MEQLIKEMGGTQFVFDTILSLFHEYIDDSLFKWITPESSKKDLRKY